MNDGSSASDQTPGLRSRGLVGSSPTAPTTKRRYRPRGEPALVRVMALVTRRGPDECWPFTGQLTRDGYGRINCGSRALLAHKVVLEARLGRPLAAGEVTRHGESCETRACCNPDHLQAGTPVDNVNDMLAAGRQARGESVGSAKLTALEVLEIRRLAASMGRGRYESLGRRFGVTGKQIANICTGTKWKHLELTPDEHARVHKLATDVATGHLTLAEAERLAVRR